MKEIIKINGMKKTGMQDFVEGLYTRRNVSASFLHSERGEIEPKQDIKGHYIDCHPQIIVIPEVTSNSPNQTTVGSIIINDVPMVHYCPRQAYHRYLILDMDGRFGFSDDSAKFARKSDVYPYKVFSFGKDEMTPIDRRIFREIEKREKLKS
jgi:hypothetical protein